MDLKPVTGSCQLQLWTAQLAKLPSCQVASFGAAREGERGKGTQKPVAKLPVYTLGVHNNWESLSFKTGAPSTHQLGESIVFNANSVEYAMQRHFLHQQRPVVLSPSFWRSFWGGDNFGN